MQHFWPLCLQLPIASCPPDNHTFSPPPHHCTLVYLIVAIFLAHTFPNCLPLHLCPNVFPHPHSATGRSTPFSATPALRCHLYSGEHLPLLETGSPLPFSAGLLNRDDSWKSDSAGNPSDIVGQFSHDEIKGQDSGGGSVVVETLPSATASVTINSVRSGYAVVHHRQQACAGQRGA